VFTQLKQSTLFSSFSKLSAYFPAIFFLSGFAWDALTIGRQVQQSDLIILSVYLLAAGLILAWLARLSHQQYATKNTLIEESGTLVQDRHSGHIEDKGRTAKWFCQLKERAPYFLLQFIFGSLLSALFIVYFKSASHWVALFWTLGLAGLLVGNEFLEEHYAWLPLSWSMFGLCAILLFNFLLPCLVGSIHAIWFYLSTVLGVALTHWLYNKTHTKAGKIIPVWLIAGVLMTAYSFDWIPPVPLVKQEVVFGTHFQKSGKSFVLQIDRVAWWELWKYNSSNLYMTQGEAVYCVSAVFAPGGLSTKLFHRWQFHDLKRGWVTTSRIGFSLNGGRQKGFRGFTYIQNWQAGEWRVAIETEDARTLSVDEFNIVLSPEHQPPRDLISL
jgi:hypothetical protein